MYEKPTAEERRIIRESMDSENHAPMNRKTYIKSALMLALGLLFLVMMAWFVVYVGNMIAE